MGRRLVASLSGGAVALLGVGIVEAWHREHELGSMRVLADPPGLKYVLDPSGEDDGRGWREDRPVRPHIPGVPRVVCVGDSVTFGVSVAPDDTWCEVLGRGLGAVEVYNFGMNGYDAEQVATLLEARVAVWEPDVVVWGTYVNDLLPTYLLYGQDTGAPVFVGTDVPEQARLLPEPISLWLARHSAFFRRLQGAAYSRSAREPMAAPAWYGAQVDRVAAWSGAQGVPVVYFALPPHVMADMATCPSQFARPDLCAASSAQHATILAALRERSIGLVDALPALQASGQPHFHPPGRLDPDHPNAAGHKVLGRAVLPAVRAALGGAP